MSLRDVMAFIQKQYGTGAADTPDTPLKPIGYQPKPAWIGACTPDTPDTPAFNDGGVTAQKKEPGEASNDASASDPAPVVLPPAPAPAPELPDWRTLDRAYLAHHTHCHICQAAGRGARYGLRCGVGASLWCTYTEAVMLPGALPWQKQNGFPHDGRSA